LDSLTQNNSTQPKLQGTLKTGLYIAGTFLLFFFALDLMISSFQHLGHDRVQTIIQATTNPFTGLFIGLLITAMIQSSSTTTALVVALVASGSLNLQAAVPIIMGANVGTTITSTIISLGFIGNKKEYKRAVAAGTYHCFFNLLTVLVLFPLEYYYRVLSTLSANCARIFFPNQAGQSNEALTFWWGFNPIIHFLVESIPGVLLIVISFVLLFTSVLLFRRMISDLLKVKSPEAFGQFVFKNPFKSFSWGLITTAAIRSSTITTSVVVPLVAKKITGLRMAAPFIMGANVGTTITAFIAAALNNTGLNAISIAIAHLLFNMIGVMLFFPVTAMREIPIKLAATLGKVTLNYPLACFVFILLTFFIIPFSLIYLNQSPEQVLELTYRVEQNGKTSYYRIVARENIKDGTGDWSEFLGRTKGLDEQPVAISSTRLKGNSFFVGDDAYIFAGPGACADFDNAEGKSKICVEGIHDKVEGTSVMADSIYVFRIKPFVSTHGYTCVYFNPSTRIIVKREKFNTADSLVSVEILEKAEHL
jgi:solute carrier family 34 (sodium-dependent phosphate cotransporter)